MTKLKIFCIELLQKNCIEVNDVFAEGKKEILHHNTGKTRNLYTSAHCGIKHQFD